MQHQRKHVALLTEEIARLTSALKESETERINLQSKAADLEKEIDRLRPKQDLADDTIKILRLVFDCDLSVAQVARALGISEGMADYHCGVLQEKLGFIALPSFGAMGVEPQLYITQKGREYLVSRGLV